ncbi:MAG: aspartyl/asparaginyl beta-hydroxylase domain-containing protein [Aquihabitans sp.]
MSLVGRTMQWFLAKNEAMVDRAVPKTTGPLDTRDFPWMAPLEAHWEEIAAEVDELRRRRITLPEVSEVAGFDQGNEGSWTNFVIYSYGKWIDVNAARAPRTTALVRNIPNLQIAGFSVLGPGAHLPRHRGPNRGALRYQIGLRVPPPEGSCRIEVGNEMHVWSEGASMVFDHSVEHEAWNDSDADRYVLFIEFIWPLKGVPGLVNRVTQRVFSMAAHGLPDRVVELDAAMNAHDRPATGGSDAAGATPTKVG